LSVTTRPARQKEERSVGFGYVARTDAQVLILGSLPGTVSLQRGEYYAQPRNAFWRIMGEIAGASPGLPYQERLHMLNEHGIALWDVCAAGCRPGSLDSAIELSSVETNDFSEFLRLHNRIGLICFNGQKAKQIFECKVQRKPRQFFENIRYELLPSTSPANAGMPYEQKLARWRAVLEEVRNFTPAQRRVPAGTSEKLNLAALPKEIIHEENSTVSG
jgi:double-stranded uracil-DNA glycosylase